MNRFGGVTTEILGQKKGQQGLKRDQGQTLADSLQQRSNPARMFGGATVLLTTRHREDPSQSEPTEMPNLGPAQESVGDLLAVGRTNPVETETAPVNIQHDGQGKWLLGLTQGRR